MDRNSLDYWFPKLQRAGLPVPRTEIVRYEHDDLTGILEGEMPRYWDDLVMQMNNAVRRIGLPCFLRSGQTSGKHNWSKTCLFTGAMPIGNHVRDIVEFSCMADFFGLDVGVWAVRELLPTQPIAVLPRYNGFPLVQEVRGFVRDGKIECKHDYWPAGAIEEGFYSDDKPANLAEILERSKVTDERDLAEIDRLLERVAAVFAGDGGWSVDVLKTTRGFYVTDMAVAEQSYHDPECPHAPAEMRERYQKREKRAKVIYSEDDQWVGIPTHEHGGEA